MNKTVKRSLATLLAMIVLIFACMGIADSIQRGGGKIDVSLGTIQTPQGELTYKLYVPETATEENKAPAVLLLHGYQNDKETCAAYAIELARRGAVVMSLDEYGHGGSTAGLLNRGYVNHRVKTIFGEDSVEDGTFTSVGGAKRFRLMMNFSNLSFFDDRYTQDADGNSITDSSAGGIAGYWMLSKMPMVDTSRMGISGHSMGTWSSWSVAGFYSDFDIIPKATVLQCGELFRESAYDSENIHFNNVLLLQAKYDEFSYFRDYRNFVDDELLHSDVRAEFLGVSNAEAAWDTTFGSFADGTARRMELLETNHRLTTHDKNGLAVAIQWFDDALDLPVDLEPTNQVAMVKEWLVFAAMLLAVFAMLPFMELLLAAPYFKKTAVGLPSRENILPKKKWWKGAAITMAIAGATYPFMTQLGHGLLPVPEGIMRMTIGTGFFSWYLLLIAVMLVTALIAQKKAKKAGKAIWHDQGLAGPGNAEKPDWHLLGRSALLAGCMVTLMYGLVILCEKAFALDFRFIWPFFKGFSAHRFIQFLVYIPWFALFFCLSGSKIFAAMRVDATYEKGLKGFLSCWWRYALLMIGGVLVIVLIEYIPFFAGFGPGADLLFGSTFGGPFMSILIVFVPQVLVFSVLGTYIYRRTGNAWIGSLTIATLACWIITGGSAML